LSHIKIEYGYCQLMFCFVGRENIERFLRLLQKHENL